MKLNAEKLQAKMFEMEFCIKDLERESHVSASTITRLLYHDTVANRRTVAKLAKALQVNPQEILKTE
jgi:lambda repressor-like predicted transcriptional regulator